MKALYYPEYDRLTVADCPIPVIGDNEVLLKVEACGICGSELETFRQHSARRKPPLIMGHEFAGRIAEVGTNVRGFEKGQAVSANAVIHCGNCRQCTCGKTNLCENRKIFGMHLDGAFAEFVAVPVDCLVPIPEGVTFQSACLAEPLANGIHMVNLSKHVAPKRILVIGAGPIGLLCQQAFQALVYTETVVADLRDERLDVAKRLGAAVTINPVKEDLLEKIRELTDGEGIDLVIDAVGGSLTNTQALHAARPGGVVILIGLYENSRSLMSYDIILDEKQVIGSYAATRDEIRQALNLMAEQKVDLSSWIHYYPLSNGENAFRNMLKAEGSHIKSVILPEG